MLVNENALGAKKTDRVEISASLTRELHFRASGPSKSIQNATQNQSTNQCIFSLQKMSAKVSPRGSQEGPQIAPKGIQKESEQTKNKKHEKLEATGRVRPEPARGRKER